MIFRFHKVINGIYRGSAPTPQDVKILKEKYHIKKIISLDEESGEKISDICKQLQIKQVKIYISDKASVMKLMHYNLKKLLLDDGPSYIHCLQGKDRTGLLVALFKVKYMNIDPEKAIKEAKKYGFGIGVNSNIISLYEKLIKSCKSEDNNNANDIVSNTREYISDNRSSALDEARQCSFAPYVSRPPIYNELQDQSETRENYVTKVNPFDDNNDIPSEQQSLNIGVYDNAAGINGTGFVNNVGGFIYE